MRPTRRRFLTVFAAAALSDSARATPITRRRFHALGTKAQITLVGRPEQAEAAMAACQVEVAAIEAAFSLHDLHSMLSRLNREGRVGTDARFDTLLRHALAMAKATGGAFDPTIQPLWRALAGGGDVETARRLVDWRALLFEEGFVRFSRTGMAASFNGIAQGFAADRVSSILARYGFHDTLVDLGEFAARGAKPGQPWRLGIRDPLTQRITARIEPKGAIATSEPHGTLIAGTPHILDPLARPGARWASVTVEAREAWRADALSTAIAASPIGEAERLLAKGGAMRSWLIAETGALHEWPTKKDPQIRV